MTRAPQIFAAHGRWTYKSAVGWRTCQKASGYATPQQTGVFKSRRCKPLRARDSAPAGVPGFRYRSRPPANRRLPGRPYRVPGGHPQAIADAGCRGSRAGADPCSWGSAISRRDLWELTAQLSQPVKRHTAESHGPTKQVRATLGFHARGLPRHQFDPAEPSGASRAVVRFINPVRIIA